jgi:hypothetical protein
MADGQKVLKKVVLLVTMVKNMSKGIRIGYSPFPIAYRI